MNVAEPYETPSDEELGRLFLTDVVMNTITKSLMRVVHAYGGHISIGDAAKITHSYIHYARLPIGPYSAPPQPPSRDNPTMN